MAFGEGDVTVRAGRGRGGGRGHFSFLCVLKNKVLGRSFVIERAGVVILIIMLVFVFVNGQCIYVRQLHRVSHLRRRLHSIQFRTLSVSSRLANGDHRSRVRLLVRRRNVRLRTTGGPPCRLCGWGVTRRRVKSGRRTPGDGQVLFYCFFVILLLKLMTVNVLIHTFSATFIRERA